MFKPVNRVFKNTLCIFLLAWVGTIHADDEAAVEASQVPLYSHATVEYLKKSEGGEHQFLFSTPKRINNSLYIENELLLSGERHDLLLKLKITGTLKDAFNYYKNLIASKGKLAYLCEERACGGSNYWANDIFNESKLYGRDSEQYYLAGRIRLDGKDYVLSAYVVQNGRRQHYIYLSYIKDTTQKLRVENPLGLEQSAQLKVWEQGVYFEKPELSDEQIAFITQALNDNKSLKLWLASYRVLPKAHTVPELMGKSEQALTQFKAILAKQLNIDEGRVKTKNVGPFYNQSDNQSAVEWFRIYLLN